MMEIAAGFPRDIIALIWHEKLADDDVRSDLTPEARDALASKHDVRLLAKLLLSHEGDRQIPTLDDLARGVGQWRDVGRIAIVTDAPLFRHAVQFFGPFFHSPIRVFSNSQSHEARLWLRGHSVRY